MSGNTRIAAPPVPPRNAGLVPRLGLGTSSLAGLYQAIDDASARATVDRAWELGVRYFDTAPLYGSGLGERRLGKALRRRDRAEFVVSTKVGRLLRPGRPDRAFIGAPRLAPEFDFTPAGLRASLEESLLRLRLDYVDIVLIHDPDEHLEQALESIDQVRDLAPAVGLGTNRVSTALYFLANTAIDVLLIAGRYTLLDRSAGDELLPLCRTRAVPVIAGGVFNSGILAGGNHFDYDLAPAPMIQRTRALQRMCDRHDVPLQALAMQFPLRHPAIDTVLVGARSAAEISADVAYLAWEIPESLWDEALRDASVTE